ncbi:MAG TPA: CHAD domain-containing protein [Tepidiformaceae bacterium]|nr:CHAD domain-containing protein [Tepidiformaceae bacterium]
MPAKPPADHIEVEWQFAALDVRPVARWLESAAVPPGYTLARGPRKELDDTYYDTPDWRVHRANFTARVRKSGEKLELTLKAMAAAEAAMRSRRELNEPLSTDQVADELSAPGAARAALRAISGRRPLRAIFHLHTSRQIFGLADADGELGEVALDETAITVGPDEPPARLVRVEVEVAADAVKRARPFVDALVAACSLSPAGPSKFESALIATGQAVPPVTDLGPTTITPEMTAGEVAFAVMRKHFAVFLQNEPGTRLGEDIEALHDMRVATRRLRAAMSAFRPFISPRLEATRLELGWVGTSLGEVRDLDVQIERMEEWRGTFDSAALDELEALLDSRRVAARKRMLAALDSRRYDLLVERFSAILRRGPARTYAPGRVPILAVAPDLIERRYRRLRKGGDGIRKDSAAAAYHALRIEGKKLRYALEFVGPIYGEQALAFARRVTALQDLLGLHQDADVAQDMLREMAGSAGRRLSPGTVLTMGMIAERYRSHAAELRQGFPGVYRSLRGKEWDRLVRSMEKRRPPAAPPPRIQRRPSPTLPEAELRIATDGQ